MIGLDQSACSGAGVLELWTDGIILFSKVVIEHRQRGGVRGGWRRKGEPSEV